MIPQAVGNETHPPHPRRPGRPRRRRPGTEEARIEALRARYDQIRKSKSDRPADERARVDLAMAELKLRVIMRELDELARQPAALPGTQEWVQKREREIRADRILKDLYDMALYDREKAADK